MFDSLEGGTAGAAGWLVRPESGCIGANKDVTGDEMDEGGRSLSGAMPNPLYDSRQLARGGL